MRITNGSDDANDDGDSRQCLLKSDMYWALGTAFYVHHLICGRQFIIRFEYTHS